MKSNSTAFSIFRILFGGFLLIHFAQLLPYAEELFGYNGVFSRNSPSPFATLWPNPLFTATPNLATAMIVLGCIASLAILLGRFRKTAALYLWYLSTCLFTANPLIANPSQGYLGLLLLFLLLIPQGEKWVLGKKESPSWYLPPAIKHTAWALLAIGYTFSGIMKLSSPSWIDGTALIHVLENPLARSNTLTDTLLQLPEIVLKSLTWSTLLLEIFFLPLAFIKKTRPWVWLAAVGMHLGIMCVIDFADLSSGMLLFHLFSFSSTWLPARQGQHILFIDGECSFCHSSTKLLGRCDPETVLKFSSLQGTTAQRYPIQRATESLEAVVLVENADSTTTRTWYGADAILRGLFLTGGLTSLLWPLHWLPNRLKTIIYQLIAKRRHAISKLCPIPTPEQRQQLLP